MYDFCEAMLLVDNQSLTIDMLIPPVCEILLPVGYFFKLISKYEHEMFDYVAQTVLKLVTNGHNYHKLIL